MQEPFFGALDGHRTQIAESAFVAPATVVVGRVRISALQCTVQERAAGYDEEIVIGEDTNVQDLSMMHADPGFPAVLEDRVTVGHRAIVHGATVEDDVLVGMGAILLNGARIGSGSVIAAGTVVTPGTEIPENSLVVGLPAKVVREVRNSDRQMIRHASESYVRKSEVHRGVEALSAQEVRG